MFKIGQKMVNLVFEGPLIRKFLVSKLCSLPTGLDFQENFPLFSCRVSNDVAFSATLALVFA